MIAYQVGAKATRDAFFLSMYPVRYLPAMVAVTSAAALALAYGSTRALSAWGPERLIPTAFLVSGLLMFVEWGVSFVAPGLASILLYAHYGCLGALLVSGFWQFINERFDPRTAKRQLGRLTAAATVGGLLGGLAASQIAGVLPLTAMIPILAALHIVCAVAIARMGPLSQPVATMPGTATPTPVPRAEEGGRLNPHTVAKTPYIRGLIGLVLLATVSEGLIDLVLKGRASLAIHDQARLLQFFAYFYTAASLVTVLVQVALSRWLLERLGPARSAAALPAGVAIASVTGAAFPGLGSTIATRAVESVLSNSLFRAGYEVLFTPVPQREKRAIKSLADVGTSRMGDILAAGMAQAVIVVLGMQHAGTALLVMAAALSTIGFFVALGLHRGYVGALARGLRTRAVQLDISDVQDGTTRSTVLQTLGPLALSQIMRVPRPGTGAEAEGVRSTGSLDLGQDSEAAAELARIRDLPLARSRARAPRTLGDGDRRVARTPRHPAPRLGRRRVRRARVTSPGHPRCHRPARRGAPRPRDRLHDSPAPPARPCGPQGPPCRWRGCWEDFAIRGSKFATGAAAASRTWASWIPRSRFRPKRPSRRCCARCRRERESGRAGRCSTGWTTTPGPPSWTRC